MRARRLTRPGRARLASVLLVGKFDADEPEPVDDESGDVPDAWPATSWPRNLQREGLLSERASSDG